MIGDWFHIDPELFHFLRPEWLWLFAPLGLLVILGIWGRRSRQTWQKVIASHLRPFMIIKGNRFATTGPLVVFSIVSSLMILSAAGPTWKKVEVPGAKSEAILLVALDLSPSMLVEDVSPNRLERAKFKIRDLLEANPGSKVGLMVYAGTAHPVVTPCSDYKLIAYQLESLSPAIMPVAGTNLRAALDMADTILARTEAPSTLFLVTDNLEKGDSELLGRFASETGNKLEILALATLQGGRIPGRVKGTFMEENGKVVLSKLDQSILFDLQKLPNIHVNTLSIENDDVELIAKNVRDNLDFSKTDEESEEDWEEMGFVLLWPALLLFILWFRKGWMIHWCVLVILASSCSSKIESWQDLWYTSDYQGQLAMNESDFQEASDRFTSLPHRGAAYYKAGDYESAIQVFMQDSSATGMFNLGLAYAASGQNELAEEALLLAQKLSPENSEIASAIEKNQDAILQSDSLRSLHPESALALENEEDSTGELNERKAASKDEELSSDTEVDELPKDGDRVTDEVESGIRKAEEMERPPDDFQSQNGENAQNVMIREISADPSEFLRRRFRFQYEKYYSEEKLPSKPW